MATCPPFALTTLTEPNNSVTQALPAGFDPTMAYLLGQCCSLTYVQFDAGLNWTPDFSSLALPGYTITASQPQPFSVYEANEPGPTTGDVGDYYQVPAGFAVQLELTPSGGGNAQQIVVVALRGTRTWEEWFADADGFPTAFAAISGEFSDGLGSVHAGFYGLYTMGENGNTATQPLNPTWDQRASGAIAYQVGNYVSQLDGSLPIYVTGHSLGGALATLCALDIAYNFAAKFSEISMYSLASPRVAAGLSDSFDVPIPALGYEQGFLFKYQTYVPNSYQIVHASDIIPILPPLTTSLGPLTLSFAQVTDSFQVGSGAVGTANISDGAVTAVSIDNTHSTGYLSAFPPIVQFSGGGGSGARATASISIFGNVDITVTNGGSGYTSAPSVEIISSGALPQNVINFCAQTGDIGCNHGCVNTYVPYLAALAANFAGP
jgi:hypothetical protein